MWVVHEAELCPEGAERSQIMASKNIVVKDAGLKVVLFPKANEDGTEFKLNASESTRLRAHVAEYVKNDTRGLPYDDRLNANKRVGLKRNNGLFQGKKGESIMQMLVNAKARSQGTAPAKEAAPAPAKAAAGTSAPRKRTKSDIHKMTKADLVRLIEEAGLVK